HRAQKLGIEHPENMTRVELVRAIAQCEMEPSPKAANSRAGSWLDIARQLLAAVVEQGLNMPDAAALIRGEAKLSEPPKPQPPLATVTLAKIYAAQGHVTRALGVLTEVLKAEPDHQAALDLQTQIKNKSSTDATRRKVQPPVGMRVAGAEAATAVEPSPAPHAEVPVQALAQEVQPPTTVAVPARTEVSEQRVTEPGPSEQAGSESQVSVNDASQPAVLAGGEQDSLVLLVRDGAAPVLCWELAKPTEAARLAGNAVEIEWLAFTPSWQGPVRQQLRIPVTHATGRMAAPKVAAPTLTHAVLGLRQAGKLVPLAVLVVAEPAPAGGEGPRLSRGHTASREAAAALLARAG
ncbi:MAG TPA: hypothetical protein VHO25_07075, partial [Polyangiaceae bacterium]|nr:hypothetical protein [Polyangiaceae bacterium]